MFAPHIQGIPLPTSKPTSEANQCNRNLRQTMEKAARPWEKMVAGYESRPPFGCTYSIAYTALLYIGTGMASMARGLLWG